jgi:hypothetical protein
MAGRLEEIKKAHLELAIAGYAPSPKSFDAYLIKVRGELKWLEKSDSASP